jgi:hypothetical protein
MKISIKEVIDLYCSHDSLGVTSMETRMLDLLYDIQEWNKLDDNGKYRERSKTLEFYKAKFSDDYRSIIIYEEKVLRLLRLIINFLDVTEDKFSDVSHVNSLSADDFYLFRLRNMLYCEKEMVNRMPKIENTGHVPSQIVNPIFEKLRNSECYVFYKLHDIDILYSEVIDLHYKEPYK